jgi:hypothetical protein
MSPAQGAVHSACHAGGLEVPGPGSAQTDASGHEILRVCGQLAPGSRPSEFQFRGHLWSRWAGHVFSAGVRRVVMLVVPPVWMGLR